MLIAKFLSRLPNVETANIILNDTPRNDFSVLTNTIVQQQSNLSGDGRRQIFVSMVPKSFYEQVVLKGSIDVGICTSALHWLLPEAPGIGHNYLPEQDAAQRAAHNDLTAFLKARSLEFNPGGILVLGILGSGGRVSLEAPFRCMAQVYKDMQEAGEVSPDDIAKIQGPMHFRTLNEVLSVAKEMEVWKVVAHVCNDVPLPLDGAFRAKWGEVDDAPDEAYQQYAGEVCDFITASAANTIHAAAKNAGMHDTQALLARIKERFCTSFPGYHGPPLGSLYIYVRLERQ